MKDLNVLSAFGDFAVFIFQDTAFASIVLNALSFA
jgi:hypothetical protein